MSKAKYNEHSSPLFKQNKIIKFKDIHSSQLCQIMYDFVNYNLPPPLMDNSEILKYITMTRDIILIYTCQKLISKLSEEASYTKALTYGSIWIVPSNIQTHERHLK